MIALRGKNTLEGATWSQKWLQMAHLFPCEEAQAPPEPEKKTAVSKSRGEDNDDAEVIFVEWSTSLKPSVSEWFQLQSQSFLTFLTEWPGTHLQEEWRTTWVRIPPACCNLQMLGPQHQSQLPYHQLLSVYGEEEAILLFLSLRLNLIIKRALWKLSFTIQNYSLCGLLVSLEPFSH